MKLKLIATACALLAAGSAFAHGPSVTPDLTVFISGASAQQKTIGSIVADLAVAGTLDVYYDAATNGADQRGYFFTAANTGDASVDGKKVLVLNRAAGGSVYGVVPVARSTALAALKVDATCTKAAGATVYTCPSTVNLVPDAGVSDVEPALFVGMNLPTGWTALSGAEVAGLDVASQNGVVFGIAATNNLYAALQAAQGLGADYSDANRPSLSRAQLTSLMTGALTDWSAVGVASNGAINVGRRTAGSGTQASANAWFGGFPCSTGAVPLATAQITDTLVVNEAGSTGGVRTFLNNTNNAGGYAIGLVSLENAPGASDKWHHIKIDGIDPTKQNVIDGKYDYYVEQTMQWKTTLAGAKLAFLQAFRSTSADALKLDPLPGVVALPTALNANPGADAVSMKGTRFNNTCQPTQLYF